MRIRDILLAATLLAVPAAAGLSQTMATYDPEQFPAIKGRVEQYSLTPRGDVDGVILQDGTQVHLPPHLGGQLVQAIKPGDSITIHGLKARTLPLIQAASIKNDASGQNVVDNGLPVAPPQPLAAGYQWLQVQGKVREPLYGPLGDLNGALLEDGTQVHLPPEQAVSLTSDLQAGHVLVAQGYGVVGIYGKVLDAQQIGSSAAQLVQVGPPSPAGAPPSPPGGPGIAPPPPPPPIGAGVAPPPPPPTTP